MFVQRHAHLQNWSRVLYKCSVDAWKRHIFLAFRNYVEKKHGMERRVRDWVWDRPNRLKRRAFDKIRAYADDWKKNKVVSVKNSY